MSFTFPVFDRNLPIWSRFEHVMINVTPFLAKFSILLPNCRIPKKLHILKICLKLPISKDIRTFV